MPLLFTTRALFEILVKIQDFLLNFWITDIKTFKFNKNISWCYADIEVFLICCKPFVSDRFFSDEELNLEVNLHLRSTIDHHG